MIIESFVRGGIYYNKRIFIMIGIYAFFRRNNNKCLYVGQSKNLEHRTRAHMCPSGMFYNKDVYYEFVETFDYYDLENQLNREAYWINVLNPELNIFRNRTWDEDYRQKFREINTGVVFTPERCKHISEALKGKKHNNEFKEKRRNHMKGNTINIDRVHIHKDEVNKNVKQNDLQKYLNSGWSLGWNINTCEKKWMNNGVQNKYVKPEEIKEYEYKGWKLGFFYLSSKKKWMNNGIKNKYVKPEEIQEYESKGWKLGFININNKLSNE